MAAETFTPSASIDVYCRFCKKVLPAQLDRSIAASGKTVDRGSTFEYFCTKCQRSFCFAGTDLIPGKAEGEDGDEPRDYSPDLHFLVGEVIYHKKFEETGAVVSKEIGSPSCIMVNFEKSGMKKLVENAEEK